MFPHSHARPPNLVPTVLVPAHPLALLCPLTCFCGHLFSWPLTSFCAQESLVHVGTRLCFILCLLHLS